MLVIGFSLTTVKTGLFDLALSFFYAAPALRESITAITARIVLFIKFVLVLKYLLQNYAILLI